MIPKLCRQARRLCLMLHTCILKICSYSWGPWRKHLDLLAWGVWQSRTKCGHRLELAYTGCGNVSVCEMSMCVCVHACVCYFLTISPALVCIHLSGSTYKPPPTTTSSSPQMPNPLYESRATDCQAEAPSDEFILNSHTSTSSHNIIRNASLCPLYTPCTHAYTLISVYIIWFETI